MEKITRYKDLTKIVHELYCEDCQCLMTNMNDMVYATDPIQYPYICPECGKTTLTTRSYPWVEIVGVKCYEEFI